MGNGVGPSLSVTPWQNGYRSARETRSMDRKDEQAILNAAREGLEKLPTLGVQPWVRSRIPAALAGVPKEALDYTVREVRDVLLRAYREGRI